MSYAHHWSPRHLPPIGYGFSIELLKIASSGFLIAERRFSSKSSFIRNNSQPAFTVGGEGKTGLDVFGGQVREVVEDFLYGHTSTEIIKNVRHGDARAAYRGLAASNARINCDAISTIHNYRLVFAVTTFMNPFREALLRTSASPIERVLLNPVEAAAHEEEPLAWE